MEIVYKKLNEIKPYERNPRKNEDSIDKVAESIRVFGFKQPIVIDSDGVIICGHTRYMASKSLKLDKVPCVVANDLTEEQVRAYRLADNKVAESSEWDYDLLDGELEDILTIDMTEFGFEFVDAEEERKKNAETTQKRVENIENLALGQYDGDGYYDIPVLYPVKELPEIKEWIGFNYVLSDDNPEGKGVHFFIDDYQFERIWNDPGKYVEKLRKYAAVATPDFSPYGDMPNALQIYNHYRKHWVGAFLQEHGVTVIPTIRSSTDKRSLDWYLDGEPRGGIVMISSMWATRDDVRDDFLAEYNKMYETLKPCKVFVYGNKIDGIDGNIEYVENFTKKRWNS